MRKGYLTTKDLADAVGCHVNTVHLYESWAFIPPVTRDPDNRYRMYSRYHLEQFKLAYLALKYPYPGGKEVVLDLVYAARDRDLPRARQLANAYLNQIAAERSQAEAAIDYLEGWVSGREHLALEEHQTIGKAAALLGLTIDTLRSWERDGLINVPRDSGNNYRQYGPEEIGRLRVIRVLVNGGYSHMAVLRLMLRLDRGEEVDLRQALDTPRADEEIFHITDQWLSALDGEVDRVDLIVDQLNVLGEVLKDGHT
jgi:DNA-binding transcriptional MerR regulator